MYRQKDRLQNSVRQTWSAKANTIICRTCQHTMHWRTDLSWTSSSACCRRGCCSGLSSFWTSCVGFNSSWSRVLWFGRGGGVIASCGRPLTCNDGRSSLHFVWRTKEDIKHEAGGKRGKIIYIGFALATWLAEKEYLCSDWLKHVELSVNAIQTNSWSIPTECCLNLRLSRCSIFQVKYNVLIGKYMA